MSRGLFGALAAAAGGVRERLNEVDITALLNVAYGSRAKSGVSVTIDSALGVTAVFAATRALAEGIAGLPFKVIQKDDRDQTRVAREHPAHRVVHHKPNGWMTSFGFRESLMYHAVLAGDAFAFKVFVGAGKNRKLKELLPIPRGNVTVHKQDDHSLAYEVTDGKGVLGRFGQDQIFHLRGPSWDTYKGLEAVKLAREAIGLSIASEQNHALLHRNGSRVGGILTTEQALNDKTIARIRALWDAKTTGIEGSYGTRILDKGMRYEKMGMSGVDAQHIETREHQIQEICRAIGVFPMIIGYADKTATFASAEAFFTAHVRLSLNPWVTRWEEACNTQLLSDADLDAGYEFKMSVEGLLRGDWRARAAFYQVMVLTGIMTRNECRGLEDLNALDGLDEPLVPLNMGVVGQEPPDPNAPPEEQARQAMPALPNIGIAPKSLVDALHKAATTKP
ncbi:MAG TPA: phage portal protein [Beijerinckiaceae bacterium]|nr:phage portal protein [Beijerinckiaceae bacterium]